MTVEFSLEVGLTVGNNLEAKIKSSIVKTSNRQSFRGLTVNHQFDSLIKQRHWVIHTQEQQAQTSTCRWYLCNITDCIMKQWIAKCRKLSSSAIFETRPEFTLRVKSVSLLDSQRFTQRVPSASDWPCDSVSQTVYPGTDCTVTSEKDDPVPLVWKTNHKDKVLWTNNRRRQQDGNPARKCDVRTFSGVAAAPRPFTIQLEKKKKD